jgi:hypothetical protein
MSKVRVISNLIIIFVILFVIVLGVIAYRTNKLELFITVISMLYGAILTAYIKSPKAYLCINKYLLRPFYDRWNTWNFSALFEDVKLQIGFEEFYKVLRNQLEKDPEFVVIMQASNICKIKYKNDLVVFTLIFEISTEEDEEDSKKLFIKTNSFNVPDTNYEEMWELIYKVLTYVKKALKSYKQEIYNLTVEYKENPYYGFFLKQIPYDFIEKFSLKIKMPTTRGNYRILVDKQKIDISTNDPLYLKEGLFRVLELSEV